MKKNIDHFMNLILDEKKEISFVKKLSEKHVKILLNRVKKDVSNTYKYYLSSVICSILSDFDNLEKSLSLSFEKGKPNTISNKISDILDLFSILFKKYHVTTINETNVIFDPAIHQAISVAESTDVQTNHIIMVMQKGYKIHDRILRPAMVVVAK